MRIDFSERQPYMAWRGHNPLVLITLRYGGNETTTYAMVDSGSDGTLLHSGIAEDLGIALDTGAENDIFGIKPDEPITGFTHKVDLSVGGVAIGEVDVDFSSEIDDDWTAQLLGRHMVFDRLRIGFRQALPKGWIYLGPEARPGSIALELPS